MSMSWPQRVEFAHRQTLDRGRGLSGFLSRLSVLGLILAVALLLAVLSVMNGFERELEQRILALIPHVTIRGLADNAEWQAVQDEVVAASSASHATLFHERDVLVVRGHRVSPARWLGLEPTSVDRWRSTLGKDFMSLGAGQIAIGQALAKKLQVAVGDKLRFITPRDSSGPAGTLRAATLSARIVGLIQSGTELDEGLILGDFTYVASAAGEAPIANGLALQLDDLFAASAIRRQLSRTLPRHFYVTDWPAEQGNLFSAIQLSRDLIMLLLLSIIAVAAFNVISSLVLVVKDRQGAIAMLRAMGASRQDIAAIYLLQGGFIGVLGASLGLLIGAGLAIAAPYLARGLEIALNIQLLSTDVYPLSFLPVDLRIGDALLLWMVSVLLCVLAAVLPARRAIALPVATILANQIR